VSRRTCAACGAEIVYQGRGRPRKFCAQCVPSGRGAAAIRAWRAVNPEKVEVYNAGRRVNPWPRPCVVCGDIFTPIRNRDAKLCGRSACRRKSARLDLAAVRTEA
jgi:hypothetical protein